MIGRLTPRPRRPGVFYAILHYNDIKQNLLFFTNNITTNLCFVEWEYFIKIIIYYIWNVTQSDYKRWHIHVIGLIIRDNIYYIQEGRYIQKNTKLQLYFFMNCIQMNNIKTSPQQQTPSSESGRNYFIINLNIIEYNNNIEITK